MDLFTYLMAKNGHNTSVHGDLYAYLLGKKNSTPNVASGTTLEITAKKTKINKLILDKESTQTRTEGYNIMPSASAETKEANGITITCDGKGTYTINGTATANTPILFDLNEEFTIPISNGQNGNGKMYLFNNYTGDCSIAFLYDNEQIDYWILNSENRINNSYISMGNKLCNKINLYFTKGQTITNGKISPMFTNDGDTTHSFEEFTGGIASPNPDYPQEVKTVKGYKNLFDNNQTFSQGQYNNGIWENNNTRVTSDYIDIEGLTNLTIFCDLNDDEKVSLINYNLFDSSYTWLGNRTTNGDTSFSGDKTHSFSITLENVKYIRITFRDSVSANNNISIDSVKSSKNQLTASSTTLPYVPYGTNYINVNITNGTDTKNIPIPLNGNELVGIGIYKDELYIDETGHCWLNKKCGKAILNGSENFSYVNGVFYKNNFINFKTDENPLSNYFTYGGTCNNTSTAYNNGNNKLSFNSSDNSSIYLRNDNLTNATEWNNWLTNHNTLIYYVLATPQLIDLNTTIDISLYKGSNTITNSENANMTLYYF